MSETVKLFTFDVGAYTVTSSVAPKFNEVGSHDSSFPAGLSNVVDFSNRPSSFGDSTGGGEQTSPLRRVRPMGAGLT